MCVCRMEAEIFSFEFCLQHQILKVTPDPALAHRDYAIRKEALNIAGLPQQDRLPRPESSPQLLEIHSYMNS